MEPGASPQLEDGYTRIADEILEALAAARVPGTVLRLVLAVIRETYGWGEKERVIDRKRLAEIMDVTSRAMRRALAEAEARGMIQRSGHTLKLQKDFTLWLNTGPRRTGPTSVRAYMGPPGLHGSGPTSGRSGRAPVGPGGILDKASREKSRDTRQVSPPLPPATTGERELEHQPRQHNGPTDTQRLEVADIVGRHVHCPAHNQAKWTEILSGGVARDEFTIPELEARMIANPPITGDFPTPSRWVKRWEGVKHMTEFDDRKAVESEAAADEKLTPAQRKQREVDEAVRLKLEEARSIE